MDGRTRPGLHSDEQGLEPKLKAHCAERGGGGFLDTQTVSLHSAARGMNLPWLCIRITWGAFKTPRAQVFLQVN